MFLICEVLPILFSVRISALSNLVVGVDSSSVGSMIYSPVMDEFAELRDGECSGSSGNGSNTSSGGGGSSHISIQNSDLRNNVCIGVCVKSIYMPTDL